MSLRGAKRRGNLVQALQSAYKATAGDCHDQCAHWSRNDRLGSPSRVIARSKAPTNDSSDSALLKEAVFDGFENFIRQLAVLVEHTEALCVQLLGVGAVFEGLGVDEVIQGGQTMNPATEDIVKAIKGVNAKHVIILPNNSNIVMTAQQAATVLEGEVDVVVLPTKTIPQGLSAAIMYNPEATLDENVDEMKEAIANVKTGQVTFAIKDTSIDGLEIKANNYMALCEKKIVACVPDKLEALKNVLSNLVDEDSEIVTLICGEDVTEEEQEAARSFIEENYEDVECEVHVGKQPVYSFIVGVE